MVVVVELVVVELFVVVVGGDLVGLVGLVGLGLVGLVGFVGFVGLVGVVVVGVDDEGGVFSSSEHLTVLVDSESAERVSVAEVLLSESQSSLAV